MNKLELSFAIAEKAGLTKKKADQVINAFEKTVVEELKKGEKVQIVGFGTFEAVQTPEKQVRNPRTQEYMTVAACKSPKFKPGTALKEELNK